MRAQVLSLNLTYISGQVIICRGDHPVDCRKFSSIPEFYLPGARTLVGLIGNVSRYYHMSPQCQNSRGVESDCSQVILVVQ